MPPMRLLPNLVLQLEQCGEISMWFLQIIESVLNLEVMKLDSYPSTPPTPLFHAHTLTGRSLAASSSLVLLFIVVTEPRFSLFLPSFSFPFLFSRRPLSQFFSGTYKTQPSPSLLPSETYTHTLTHIGLRQGKSIVT